MLSNCELIQTFIQNSCANQEVLLSNQELKADSIFNTNQLVAKGEGLILKTQQMTTTLQFAAKMGSSHWNLITEALAERGFLLTGEPNQNRFCSFQYYKIPKNYTAHCTESVILWRAWWKHRQRIVRATIPMELFIRTRSTWYPIRDLSISDSVLFVQTFGSEIQLHVSDLVIWLSKRTQESQSTSTLPLNTRVAGPVI
jgi:hypothetical protein